MVLALLAQATPMAFFVFDVRTAQPGKLPDGWRMKVNHGTPEVAVLNDSPGHVLRLKSQKSSFALERSVDLDIAQYPWLTWNWKVTELPIGGDFRRISTDDQAAQLLVLFSDRRVLTYLWDTTAPKDTMQSASSVPLVRIYAVVCQSGHANLNQWMSERRNLANDYAKAYGRAPSRVKGLRLQINSQHTGTSAESYFGDVAFRSALQ